MNPVSTQRDTIGVDGVLEEPAIGLDRFRRPNVVVVARHQDLLNTAGSSHNETLAQDLGGVPEATVTGPNGVADMATLIQQVFVEFEANRRSPDHDSVDFGQQPCRLNPVEVDRTTVALIVDHPHELTKCLARPQECKHEILDFELALRCPDVLFIAQVRRTEAKR
jgi:hypothetical protein